MALVAPAAPGSAMAHLGWGAGPERAPGTPSQRITAKGERQRGREEAVRRCAFLPPAFSIYSPEMAVCFPMEGLFEGTLKGRRIRIMHDGHLSRPQRRPI